MYHNVVIEYLWVVVLIARPERFTNSEDSIQSIVRELVRLPGTSAAQYISEIKT